jgi:metallo-beta-lactamase class B
VLRHGAELRLGDTRFTLHATPTHSPGSTSWTWRSCEASRCQTIAYADSISTISADAYRFRDHSHRIEAARAGLRTIEALPCDVLLTPHPASSALLERLSGKAPLAGPRACIAHAQGGSQWLAGRLAKEAAAK